MFPKRKYLVIYKVQEVVEARNWFEARNIIRNRLGDDTDIEDAFETYGEYTVQLSKGERKVFAEYHRDTAVMPHSNGEDPSGHYHHRDNGHLLFIPTAQLEGLSIEDQKAVSDQILAYEDQIGDHAKYNEIVKVLRNARSELPADPGKNPCFRCTGTGHTPNCDCTDKTKWAKCCSECGGWGTIQMWIESFFISSLKNDLPRAWHWLYETGRCRVSSRKFWELMLVAAGYLEMSKEIETIRLEVLNK